jgi:hypothetical protein
MLPETVRVKLSSEDAGTITLTPVVVQELPLRELLEHILGLAGKDEGRILGVLLRGTLVSGGSRFRWAGWEVDRAALRELLATFPDPDPGLAFAPERCIRATLRGGRQAIEIPRETGARKPMFRRASFWELLMEVTAASGPVYSVYSYRDRADRYICELTRLDADRIRAAGEAVSYSTLREQIASAGFTRVELLVERA